MAKNKKHGRHRGCTWTRLHWAHHPVKYEVLVAVCSYFSLLIPFARFISLIQHLCPIIPLAGCFSVYLNPIIPFSCYFLPSLWLAHLRLQNHQRSDWCYSEYQYYFMDMRLFNLIHFTCYFRSQQPTVTHINTIVGSRILNVPHDLQLSIVTALVHICNTLFNLFTTWNQFVPHHGKLTDVTGNCQTFCHIVEWRVFDTQQLKKKFTYITVL